MTRDEFLTEMQDVLQTEETLSFETVLEELDEWPPWPFWTRISA